MKDQASVKFLLQRDKKRVGRPAPRPPQVVYLIFRRVENSASLT